MTSHVKREGKKNFIALFIWFSLPMQLRYLGINFWAVHHGAQQQVRVSPAMEIGFAKPTIQRIAVDRRLNCELINKKGFDVVVERSIQNLPLPCLKLDASTVEGYKIWRVVH